MVKKKEARQCGCGCGGMTKGGAFLPGHDAKLKSRLKKAAGEGNQEALAELRERGWAVGDKKHLVLALECALDLLDRALTRFPPKADEIRLVCDAVRAVLGIGEAECEGPSPVEAAVRSAMEARLLLPPEVQAEMIEEAAKLKVVREPDVVPFDEVALEVVAEALGQINETLASVAEDGSLDEVWEPTIEEVEAYEGRPPLIADTPEGQAAMLAHAAAVQHELEYEIDDESEQPPLPEAENSPLEPAWESPESAYLEWPIKSRRPDLEPPPVPETEGDLEDLVADEVEWQPVGWMKVCAVCGASKSIREFTKDRRTKDGHSKQCTMCAGA